MRSIRSASSIVLLLVLAACGSASPPPDPRAAQNAPPAPAPSATATAASPPATAAPAPATAAPATAAVAPPPQWVVRPRLPLAPGQPAPPAPEGAAAVAAASAAETAATAASSSPPHEVAPIAPDELQRKRAEWQEHLRMTEQAQADMQAWRRSRSTSAQPTRQAPLVGAAPRAAAAEAGSPSSAMGAWYRRYSARSTAVSLAISRFGMATAANPPDLPRVRAACRELDAASAAMLADPQALAAPLDAVATPLSTAYGELHATAESCLAGRPDEQAAHLAAARQAMAAAGAALRPFNLAP